MADDIRDVTLSSILRQGGKRLGRIGEALPREIAANMEDAVDFTPIGATVRALRAAQQARGRAKREAEFGVEATVGPAPYAQHSGDPAVQLGAAALDPTNLLGAGAVTKAGKAASALRPAESKMADILRSQQAPGIPVASESGPVLPRAPGGAAAQHMEAEQVAIPRLTPTGREPKLNERAEKLLRSKKAAGSVDELIARGRAIDPDLEHWYGTEPLHAFARNEGMSRPEFERMLAQLSSASQRNPVEKENLLGSYLWQLDKGGMFTPESRIWNKATAKEGFKQGDPNVFSLPEGVGAIAQTPIFYRAKDIALGKNPEEVFGRKLSTYLRNKLGNQVPVTVDVNAIKGPVMLGRQGEWLKTLHTPKDKEGNVIARITPRADWESGKLKMKDALENVSYWTDSAEELGDYKAFEELWRRGSQRAGVTPAGGQALGWYGSRGITDLSTPPFTYAQLLERGARAAAARQGITPTEAFRRMIQGRPGSQLGGADPKMLAAIGAGGGGSAVALASALRKKDKPEEPKARDREKAAIRRVDREVEKAEQ